MLQHSMTDLRRRGSAWKCIFVPTNKNTTLRENPQFINEQYQGLNPSKFLAEEIVSRRNCVVQRPQSVSDAIKVEMGFRGSELNIFFLFLSFFLFEKKRGEERWTMCNPLNQLA